MVRDWDEETNDGQGWDVTEWYCIYCGSYNLAVHPAQIDVRTLCCSNCEQCEVKPAAAN